MFKKLEVESKSRCLGLDERDGTVFNSDPLSTTIYELKPNVMQPEAVSRFSSTFTVTVVGLGYVGLPTALHFLESGTRVIGFDISSKRIADIQSHVAELIPEDYDMLVKYLPIGGKEFEFQLTNKVQRISEAQAVIICVPSPLNLDLSPDLSYLEEACASVVAEACVGQTIILASTTYVGCTQDLLVAPLTAAGFKVGEDIFVAFSPERINPGDSTYTTPNIPRVIGGATNSCLERAEAIIKMCCQSVHLMSSLEAAEMTKLLENTFRAVNIAWINEMADIAGHAGLDVNEIINGAATKPFGFTKFTPGPGIGGHCIPCDPHYLLAGIPKHLTPLTSATMQAVVSRPHVASSKSIEMLGAQSFGPRVPKVILVGVSYKPDIQDVRESPAIEILRELESLGLGVGYYDPLVKTLAVAGKTLSCVSPNDLASADLVIWHTPHSILETNLLLADVKLVLDLTYRLDISDPRIHRLEVSSITNNFSRGRLRSA